MCYACHECWRGKLWRLQGQAKLRRPGEEDLGQVHSSRLLLCLVVSGETRGRKKEVLLVASLPSAQELLPALSVCVFPHIDSPTWHKASHL